MTIPQKYEFEGARRTVREVYDALGGSIPKKTIMDRLASGQKTAAELRQPKPRFVNPEWRKERFGRGHAL